MDKKFVVRIMATIFDEETLEMGEPKTVVLDIHVGAESVEQAQLKVVSSVESIANDPGFYLYDKDLVAVEDRMRRIAGIPQRKGARGQTPEKSPLTESQKHAQNLIRGLANFDKKK